MEQKDIMHLANLARIKVTSEEAAALSCDIDAVLEYVSTINDITADTALTKKVGVRYNIFRQDVVSNKPGEYTESLLAEAPHTDGRHVKVKKIIQTD
jgi:aspartyl/glutamyl-tRNA(Asn/Gln) amidotransferase C subunit